MLQDLQRTAPRSRQPAVAASICLLGVNCESHQKFVVETMKFATDEHRLPGSAARVHQGARRAGGRRAARTPSRRCSTPAIPSRDPARSPIALALGTVAVRNTPLALKIIGARADLRESALLLLDAFDMLEEDFEEERFFATVRRSYWQAAEGSAERKIAETLIQVLEF